MQAGYVCGRCNARKRCYAGALLQRHVLPPGCWLVCAALPLPPRQSCTTWPQLPSLSRLVSPAPWQHQCAPPAAPPSWCCACAWLLCCHVAPVPLLLLLLGPGVWAACGVAVLQASGEPEGHCTRSRRHCRTSTAQATAPNVMSPQMPHKQGSSY